MASMTDVLTALLCLCVAALGEPLWYGPTYQVLGPIYQPSTLNGPIHLPLHRSAFNDIGFGSTLGIPNIGFKGAMPEAMFEEQQGRFDGGQFPVFCYDFQAGMIEVHQGDFNGGMLTPHEGDFNGGMPGSHQGEFNGGMPGAHQGEFNGGMLGANQEHFNERINPIIRGGFHGGVFGDMIGEPYGDYNGGMILGLPDDFGGGVPRRDQGVYNGGIIGYGITDQFGDQYGTGFSRGVNEGRYGSAYTQRGMEFIGMGPNGGFRGDNYRVGNMQTGTGANGAMASNGDINFNGGIGFNRNGGITNQGSARIGMSGLRQDANDIGHKQEGIPVNTGNTGGTSVTAAPQKIKAGNIGNDKVKQ